MNENVILMRFIILFDSDILFIICGMLAIFMESYTSEPSRGGQDVPLNSEIEIVFMMIWHRTEMFHAGLSFMGFKPISYHSCNPESLIVTHSHGPFSCVFEFSLCV